MDGMGDIGRLADLSAPRRNNYFYGKLMDVPHFQMEQKYFLRQRWLLNRLSLGQGVLCGLTVAPNTTGTQISVSPGVAIDALGREIVVPTSTCVDPWQLTDACGQAGTTLDKSTEHTVFLCLAYRECKTDFMPVLVTDCNSHEQCSPGTTVETFCLLVEQVVPDPTLPSPPPPTPSPEPPPLPDPMPLCVALEGGGSLLDRRTRLSQALSGPCPAPVGDLCVPLATIELLQGGKIGSFDPWTFRPRVYSNAVLLDLILCLAQRIEECCPATPTPTPTATPSIAPTPTPTPTPTVAVPPPLLEVGGVRILHGANELTKMTNPTQNLRVPAQQFPDTIEIQFVNASVDYGTLIDQKTFKVEKSSPSGMVTQRGKIVRMPNNTAQWQNLVGVDVAPFGAGSYVVTLVGNGPPAIMSLKLLSNPALPLDGEPTQLPSGNGVQGGDFVFKFDVFT